MTEQQEQERRVIARITSNGWHIEMDDSSWAELITAVSIAIDVCDKNDLPAEQERAARLRKLRTALSKG